jgi:hypothetical protein
LKWYDAEGENGIISERGFYVEVPFSSQNVNSPLFEETLGAFLSLPLSFFYSISCGLGGFGDS